MQNRLSWITLRLIIIEIIYFGGCTVFAQSQSGNPIPGKSPLYWENILPINKYSILNKLGVLDNPLDTPLHIQSSCFPDNINREQADYILHIQQIQNDIKPYIDGKLTDLCWEQNPGGSWQGDFIQFLPNPGSAASQSSVVWIIYDQNAIYIAARLLDSAPDSISREVGIRDESGKNADEFAVYFDPFNQGQNAFRFAVSASGTQSDAFIMRSREDNSWNSVWKSAIHIDEKGWTVEMEIPYAALRFPPQKVKMWGLNFYRKIQRKQEESFWHPVIPNVDGLVNQFGKLAGIQAIKAPIRLSFMPYLSSHLAQREPGGAYHNRLNGGMDLKYGISPNFTLDMTMVPDFRQVRSDNAVLNLSPFEVYFEENRPFFTEGMELFRKGNLFYSRRVGQVYGIQEALGTQEWVSTAPEEPRLINISKLSGRTQKGLGIGMFNAITGRTYATAEHRDTGVQRAVPADPLTNFNVFVLDQNLKNNSGVSLINTQVLREGNNPDANVTGMEISLYDKSNTFLFRGFGALSYVQSKNKILPQTGHAYDLQFAKVSGLIQFSLDRKVKSATYNPNDLGFLRATNLVEHEVNLSYNQFQPSLGFNYLIGGVKVTHVQLHTPREYDRITAYAYANTQLKNFWSLGAGVGGDPRAAMDHFEARTPGYIFMKPSSYNTDVWLSSDGRRKLHIGLFTGMSQRPAWNDTYLWVNISSRFRLHNKLTFKHDLFLAGNNHQRGFADHLYNEQGLINAIILGDRATKTIINTLSGSFNFSDKMGLNLRLRHYWSTVAYNRFFELLRTGTLADTDYSGSDAYGKPLYDANFNAFNIDFVYDWQFAPGSFLSAVWKNAIYTYNNDPSPAFFSNLTQTVQEPQSNSFSIRIIYYLDYLNLKQMLQQTARDSSMFLHSQ